MNSTTIYITIIVILVISAITIYIIWYYYHKQLRRELRRAQKSERLKSIFLANVSHALRTPLNAIIGFSDVILNEKPSNIQEEQLSEMVEHINKNGHQLLYFISPVTSLCLT